MEPPAPDLSHLTEQERRIIEKVMARQREEEDKEREVFKKKQDEVLLLETAIRMRSEERQRIEGTSDLSVTCQICLKTKFADGVGHVCHYCNIRCCARCGGKVSLRSNKVIWVCLVCRKKQELVIKTGQWVQSGICHGSSHPGTPNFDQDSSRTPKIGRTRSLDKESTYPPLPSSPPSGRRGSLQRHSSVTNRELRRQFSNETGQDSRHYHDAQGRSLSDNRNSSDPKLIRSPCDPVDHHSRDDHRHNRYRERSRDPSPDVHGRRTRDHTPSRELSADRHRDRRSSFEHRDHRDRLRSDDGHRSRDPSVERRDSSKDRCRRDSSRHRSEERRDVDSHKYRSPSRPRTPREDDASRSPRSNHHHLDPNSALHSWNHSSGGNNRHQSETVVRNDSLSSDQSENVRPPPPKHRPKRGKKPRQRSFSSSDDEIRSTPEYSSCEEPEIESESISEKGEPQRSHNNQKVGVSVDEGTHESASSTRRWGHYNPGPDHLRKKTVRFHRASSQEPFWKDIGWPDQHTKDSGIDTSSSATLNEDTNNKHPISWKKSTDGSKIIGHMILKKRPLPDSGTGVPSVGLGMRVVGGRIMDNGRLGAVVENIKKSSIADTIGHIRPGDEVLEWNGRPLRDKTYEEVYEIIAESKQEPQVELRVCRAISNTSNNGSHALSHGRPPHLEIHPELLTREGNPHYGNKYVDRRPSVTVTSPRSPEAPTHRTQRAPSIGGRVQVKLWYETKMLQLAVTIVRAVELPPRLNLQPRNPYVKVILLPDKSEKNKRRTKTIANTNEPKWNQTFFYAPLRHSDLHSRQLEIGVWDYDRYSASDFLGEVLIDLGTAPLNNEGEWYLLTTHEDNLSTQLRRQMMFADAEASSSITSTDRLSPPSTNSRLSDSELSEYDFEDRFFTQTERRIMAVDGASISSLGSHCSSSFLSEENREERRSRKDHLTDAAEGRHRSTSGIAEDDVLYTPVRRQDARLPDPRGRSRSVTPGNGIHGLSSSRKVMSMSSRSLSPPEMRPRFPAPAIPAVSASRHSFQHQRSAMSAMTFKKRQLPQIPVSSSWRNNSGPLSLDFDERIHHVDLKTPIKGTSGGLAVTPMTVFPDGEVFSRPNTYIKRKTSLYGQTRSAYDTTILRRGGGSRMAAALGVGASPMVSPEIGSDSESSSMTKYSINSAFGTQLHKSSRTLGEFTSRIQGYGPVHPSQITSKEKVDGSLSDTAVGSLTDKITILDRPASGAGNYSSGSKMAQYMGLSKKSSSTSELSVTEGCGGGTRKSMSGNGLHRSKDAYTPPRSSSSSLLGLQGSGAARGSIDSSLHSLGSNSPSLIAAVKKCIKSFKTESKTQPSNLKSNWVPSMRLDPYGEMSTFVEGLGPGQLVGRQALASPILGEVQLSLCERKSNLEVEVIRARGLQPKSSAKVLPAPYIKVYLIKGQKCIAKVKTSTARRTLEPLYQEQLVFHEDFRNCFLQVTVYGDYARMEKKVFMGVAQIMLDDLDLSNLVIGWYKLFHIASLVNVPMGGNNSTRNSLLSLDSFG